ncbi:prolyl oligopeptidase family serine peptidase [Nocardia asteroides]
MTPEYDGVEGAAWITDGGISVVANIRGGGEYGPDWHDSVVKENRHKVFEDFAAVAMDLIARGITTPEQLGAIGASNGGLLMGGMLTRYPDLFGALVVEFPLLDMKRFHLLGAGVSWVPEYGHPDNPAEAAYIISPLHEVVEGRPYPVILLRTSTHDNRTHPAHARKLAALLEALGYEVWFYETPEGGHSDAGDNRQTAFERALVYAFFRRKLMNGQPPRPAGPAAPIGAMGVPDPDEPIDGVGRAWEHGRKPGPRHKWVENLGVVDATGGGWPRGGQRAQPSRTSDTDAPARGGSSFELPPSARRALETAQNDAAEVAAEGLHRARGFGVDVEKVSRQQPDDIEKVIKDLKARQRLRLDAVLRRRVVDSVTARVLMDEEVLPGITDQFQMLKPHIEVARRYTSEVREALAVLIAPDVLTAAGAVPLGDGIGVVAGGERFLVASPLLGQERLLDLVGPGVRAYAASQGIPIDYLRIQIDEGGGVSVEKISGVHDEPESAIRYYTDPDDIAWMRGLTDERPFAEKVAEAEASGLSKPPQVIKGDKGDATMSESVAILHYNNGFRLIEKKVRHVDHADAEELGARTLRDVGARAPSVLRRSELVLYIEYVPGADENELPASWRYYSPRPDARRLGLGDTLIRPWDRHEGANWRLSRHMHVVPIDNSNAYISEWPAAGFADHFVHHGVVPRLRPHHVPRAELEAVRARIIASEEHYARLNRGHWYREVVSIFTALQEKLVVDAERPLPSRAEVLRTLEERRDDLAHRFGLDLEQVTRNAQVWREAIDDLRQTYSRQPVLLEYVDELAGLGTLVLHAQLSEVRAEELDGTWESAEEHGSTRTELLDVYLAGLAQWLDDLHAGAPYPEPNGESHEEWQARFDRELQQAAAQSPATSPTTTANRPARGAMPPSSTEIATALDIDVRRARDLADPAVAVPPGGLSPGVVTAYGPGDAGHTQPPDPKNSSDRDDPPRRRPRLRRIPPKSSRDRSPRVRPGRRRLRHRTGTNRPLRFITMSGRQQRSRPRRVVTPSCLLYPQHPSSATSRTRNFGNGPPCCPTRT